MAAPKLVYATPNGQTAVLALFDQAMRKVDPTSAVDPDNPANWSVGGGLPAVASVVRRSNVEFELLLASPAPLGGPYSVTIAGTVQQAASTGLPMDPGFVTRTFSVTTADFTISAIEWDSPTRFVLTFSEGLAPISFQTFAEVLSISPMERGGRQVAVSAITVVGSDLQVDLETAGTAGARYGLLLQRSRFQALATGVGLKAGEEDQTLWGQGSPPEIASMAVTTNTLRVTGTEALTGEGWPLTVGTYSASIGSLGNEVAIGSSDSIVEFAAPSFPEGEILTFSVARQTRTVQAGTSFVSQAASTAGAGTETLGVGTTTLNKTAGDPFELVFAGGTDQFSKTGRFLQGTLAFTFAPSGTAYPLLAITFLSTQTSVVIKKTTGNLATLQLFRGSTAVTAESRSFDPTVAFALGIIDAIAEPFGFLAVSVDGEVLVGAPTALLTDNLLFDGSAGATAIALTLGAPTFPAQTFSVAFSSNIAVNAYLSTGLTGATSNDLFALSASSIAAIVQPAADPTSGGFEDTGKPAFGATAEYKEEADAVMVVVGLNEQAVPLTFAGTVSLLTGSQEVLDQVSFDQSHATIATSDQPGNELVVIFLHPKRWAGTLAGVTLEIAGADYSVIVPVVPTNLPPITAQLTQQPASWWVGRPAGIPGVVARAPGVLLP